MTAVNINNIQLQYDCLLQTELMYLVERYYARRFHGTVYFLNQLSSDLDRWEALPEHVSNLASIATLVEMRDYSSKQRRHWYNRSLINTFKNVRKNFPTAISISFTIVLRRENILLLSTYVVSINMPGIYRRRLKLPTKWTTTFSRRIFSFGLFLRFLGYTNNCS